MNRFPLIAFGALVVATVAAFFIVQHLKVATPLISGLTRPLPAVIDPLNGSTCYDPSTGRTLDARFTSVSFYVLHQSDRVDVYVVNQRGARTATLARNRFMKARLYPHEVRTAFIWNGRGQDGRIAPDGAYYFHVYLIEQRRTVTIADNSGPLRVTVTSRARSRCT